MFRNFGAPEIIVIAVLVIVIFGWKRLPDAARSLGRSARVFKSEVDEMKADSKKSNETVQGETVNHQADPTTTASPSAQSSPVQENSPHTDNQSGPTTGTSA